MSYSRKKGESCPSHTKKCVTIEFEPQNREKGVCTAQNRGESMNLHQSPPISTKIDSPGIIFTKSYPRHNNINRDEILKYDSACVRGGPEGHVSPRISNFPFCQFLP